MDVTVVSNKNIFYQSKQYPIAPFDYFSCSKRPKDIVVKDAKGCYGQSDAGENVKFI